MPPHRKSKKAAKPAAPKDDFQIAAYYAGAGHTVARCAIGDCDWRQTADNHERARQLVSAHWQEAH